MTLYSYQKAPVEKTKEKIEEEDIFDFQPQTSRRTLGEILDNLSQQISAKISSIKPISFLIPILFIFSGLSILYGQIKPYAVHYIQSKFTDRLNQEIIPLVPESYEQIRAEYISDPGAEYFSKLIDANNAEDIDTSYKGTFYLTIDKIQIYDAPVSANVDSFNEDVYRESLGHSLAHFQGTQLPGTDEDGNERRGNIFIYGHSAAGDYAEKNPGDVVTAFTRLFKLTIGDPIVVKFEDQEINYTVRKIKEVQPEEIDILNQGGGKTLTLMTCSPPGLNSKRLIVVAKQV